MKSYVTAVLALSVLYACNNQPNKTETVPAQQSAQKQPEKQNFFPVTDYLKGELFEFHRSAVTPKKYTTVKEHTDSAWLKVEEFDKIVKVFLEPVIDSVNLIHLFTEKKFMDQSLDAITYSYDPATVIPDSLKLDRWDVYIDPNTSRVKRIYIVKTDAGKTLQLTWQSGKWCKINTLINKPDGSSELEKEEKIVWAFE